MTSQPRTGDAMGSVTITPSPQAQAATALYGALLSLCSSGQDSAARALLAEVSDNLVDEIIALTDRPIAARVAGALQARRPAPADEDGQAGRTPGEQPEQPQPQSWDQRVLDGLRHALDPIRPTITVDDLPTQQGWNALVRRVRDACQAGNTEPVEILRRLGRRKLAAVDDVELPNTFLAAKVRDWTPGD